MTKEPKHPNMELPWSNDPSLRDESPRDASTVLLLREGVGDGVPEIFMVRRHGKSAFMGGLWVFPGGKVDAADGRPAMLARAAPEAPGRCRARLKEALGPVLSQEEAFAIHAAAARELFEEAGVLIATGARASDPAASLEGWRRRLQKGEASFAEMLEAEDLMLEPDRLVYLSRWITPSAEPMRFDTRFFAARVPEGQTPFIDEKETTDGAWGAAERFLEDHAAGRLTLAPPTLRHLEELSAHDSIEAYLEAMEERPVAPILPKIVMLEGTMTVVLPWDPSYDSLEGEGLDLCGEAHPLASVGGPPRFVLRDGRFFSEAART